MSSESTLFDKTSKQKTMDLASSLLTSMLNWINEDGSLGSDDASLLTHHLLLVLSAWQNENLKGVEDRAVKWFINLDDYREKTDTEYNPFKLISFSTLHRDDLEKYVKIKVASLLANHFKKEGYIKIDLGFKLAVDVRDVFPTLVGANILINEGSRNALEKARVALLWAKEKISEGDVYRNVFSINGYAALVTSLYEQATKKTEFNSWQDKLVKQVISLQKNGLWQAEDDGEVKESKYQSSYLFYDLAYLFSLRNNDDVRQAVAHLIERLHTDLLEGDEINGQHMVLIVASVLRGLAFLFSSEEKDNVVQNVIDSCIQISGEYNRHRSTIQNIRGAQQNWVANMKKENYIYANPTVFHKRGFQEDERQVFIVMPFGKKKWFDNEKKKVIDDDFDKLHSDIIQNAIEHVGLDALRADSIYSPHSFMQKIWRDINKSCLLIVDLTSGNPNVFYELGVAHTLGKPVILLAKEERYTPTDLKGADCIIYGDKPVEVVIEKLSNAIRNVLGLT